MAKDETTEIPGLFDDLPEEAPQEQIARIALRSWRAHLASIRALDKRIEKLIDEAVKQALAQSRKLTDADIGRLFQRHPELRAALDRTMESLNDSLTAAIEQGSKEAWLRANTGADAVVDTMAANNPELTALLKEGLNKPQNDRALRAFQQREMQGMKLSDRVWRATEGMKLDMERAVEVALAEGVPAQKLSQRVRELLKEPNRLYRRVRDKDGNLRLSQAAQKYHPGTGVYRSSYKNAMRVARTEVNMAYQAADSERWSRSWWVKGIRVSLSNNHTSPDSKGRPAPLFDICDMLAGDYPADFKFTGWHPQCRCFATAITCDYSDIRDYYRRKRAGEDLIGYTPSGTITAPPEHFNKWMADNRDRLTAAAKRGTTPYFIANNAKYTDPNWKPGITTEPASPSTKGKTKTELLKFETNNLEYERLKTNPNYTEVEYNQKNGGLKATHIEHEKHTKVDNKRLAFGTMTPWDLEKECQEILYQNGYSCILNSEKVYDRKTGKQIKVLDTTTNGIKVDIVSITENGKNTIKNALDRKKKQLREVNRENNTNYDSVILHFHDETFFNEEKVKKGLGKTLAKIICAINSQPVKIIVLKI